MVAAFDGGVYTNHWFWQDGRGNTSYITGDNSYLLERYTYDLSGAPSFYDEWGGERGVSVYDTRFLFAGSQYMPDTGLYDMRNRFYRIRLNRFLQTDSIGFKGDRSNLYRYCHNDAINNVDAMGLDDYASGYNNYRLVRDPEHPPDSTHDGWKPQGIGPKSKPGHVQLEISRSVSRVPRLETRGADTTGKFSVGLKEGDATIALRLDVRYATEAGFYTQRKTVDQESGEWAISSNYIDKGNYLREKRDVQVQSRGLSPEAAVAFIQNGVHSGPLMSQVASLAQYQKGAHDVIWIHWELPFEHPDGQTYSRHTPLNDKGNPVQWWQ
ncbi:MAG: hypothetical protein QOD12_365 [Verrucomicrobiota bacterium]